MPMKMKVPAEKDYQYDIPSPVGGKEKKRKPRQPKIYLPIQADWIEDLEPGQEVTVVLTGEVMKVQVSKKAEEEYGMENEMCLAMTEIVIDKENEFSKLVKEIDDY